MKEQKLLNLAREVIPDEEILGAGVFVPRGTLRGTVEGLGASGLAIGATGDASAGALPGILGGEAGRIASIVDNVPRWTLIAVTGASIYLIAVRSMLEAVTFSHPQLFRRLDRSKSGITIQLHPVPMPSALVITDYDHNEAFSFEGTNSPRGRMNSDVIFSLLQADSSDGV